LDSKDRREIEAYLEAPSKTRVISDVIRLYLGNKRSNPWFLDVGCGMGGYLLAAQQLGFQTIGFEPSTDHAHLAKDILNLPVINDYFSSEAVSGKQFDLIMLSHVIEHIYKPQDLISMLVAALKPGGVLVVVTPNSDSIIATLTGRSWVMLKPIDHVSMICSSAYQYFDLSIPVDIYHRWSEYPFEFVATVLASTRDWIFRRQTNKYPMAMNHSKPPVPPILKTLGIRTKLLKAAFTALSFPIHLIAVWTNRQACLTTVLVRKG
jgi:SAM-dependent methyltransferase